MECKRCGGSMMMETVITLRRGLFGFRETRSRGGYCFTCQIGAPLETRRSVASQPTSFIERAARRVDSILRRAGGSQPDHLDTNAIRLRKPLSLAG
jgi:hypothetical protein